MLNNKTEYDKMAGAEQVHWWYSTLHGQVAKAISNHFNGRRDIDILDAGCGTGGLMVYLQKQGYKQLKGFDVSQFAVEHCRQKGLDVVKLSLSYTGTVFLPATKDVIICCDALYFLEIEEQKKVLRDFYTRLKPGGLLILNLPALDVFTGTHDISVGIKKRYHHNRLGMMLPVGVFKNGFSYRYWPVSLSPLIAFERYRQRRLMATGSYKTESDVSMPNSVVNGLLKLLLKAELNIPALFNFGSSLFVVVKK